MRTPPRIRRWAVSIALGLALVTLVVFLVIRLLFAGSALGSEVAGILNRKMRGRVEIQSIDWSLRNLPDVIRGGWIPIELTGVTVWDAQPERRVNDRIVVDKNAPRAKLLSAPRITAEVDAHALFFGNHDLVFRTITVHGGWVRLEQTFEPYPLHDWDEVVVSLVSAFYPRMKPGFRAGIFAASTPPIFELRDVNLLGVDVEGYFKPTGTPQAPEFQTTLHVEDVNAKGVFLYADTRDPLVARFYFSLAPGAEPVRSGPVVLKIGNVKGSARADQDSTHKYRLDFKEMVVSRLAQLPRAWPEHTVASTLEIDTHLESTLGGRVHLRGELIDYFDRPFDGRWNLEVLATEMGPTLNTAVNNKISGADVRARLGLSGPFVTNPKIAFELLGLHFKAPVRENAEPLHFILDGLHGSYDFVNAQGFLNRTVARVAAGQVTQGGTPGELELSATFSSPYVNAEIVVKKPIDLGQWLPPEVAKGFGRHLGGHLRGRGDIGDRFALTDFDLALGRTPGQKTTRLHGGAITTEQGLGGLDRIEIDNVMVDAGDTRLRLTGGVTISQQALGLLVNGESRDLGIWLSRFGITPFARGVEALKLDIDGEWTNLRVRQGSGRFTGLRFDRVQIPSATVRFHYEDCELFIDEAVTNDFGGTATLNNGRISLPCAPAKPQAAPPPSKSGRLIPNHPAGSVAPDPTRSGMPLEGQRFIVGSPFAAALVIAAPVGIDFRLVGTDGDAAKILRTLGMEPHATGKISRYDLRIAGTPGGTAGIFEQLRMISGFIAGRNLTVFGEAFRDITVCTNYRDDALCRRPGVVVRSEDIDACDKAKAKKGVCLVGRALHHSGGAVDLTLSTPPRSRGSDAPLTGTVAISALPIDVIAQSLGWEPGMVSGVLSTTLHMGGTRTLPTVSGAFAIERMSILGQVLGKLTLQLSPSTRTNQLEITGSALQGRLTVEATLGTVHPYPVRLRVRGRLLELDPVLDVAKRLGLGTPLRAWTTGALELLWELGSDKPLVAWVELDDLQATFEHVSEQGTPQPLRVAALPAVDRPAVSLRITPGSAELVCRTHTGALTPCPIRLATPLGVIEIAGSASAKQLALTASGVLDLSLGRAYVRTQFDDLSGAVELTANVTGTALAPAVDAQVQLRDLRARPAGQDTIVRIPTGQIKLARGSLGFSDVRVRVDDTYLDKRAELVVRGGIGLRGLTPASWGLLIEGQIAGKMLQAILPTEFSQASGVAEIDDNLTLSGKGRRPEVYGTLRFSSVQPLAFVLRKFPRELTFRGGAITLADVGSANNRRYEVTTDDVVVGIDGEGSLRRVRGSVDFSQDFALTGADMRFDAAAIPFRVPRTLDLVLSAAGMRLSKASAQANWRLSGALEVVSGRYFASIDLVSIIFRQLVTTSREKGRPLWEEYPTLSHSDLNLTLDVRQFAVNNNVANLDLRGKVRINGTPRDPRIDNSIRVTGGSFKVPGSPVRFTRTTGEIVFSRQERFPDATPSLALRAEADHKDSSGQKHLIRMDFKGTWNQPEVGFSTSTGLDRAQTLALIFGGTPTLSRSVATQVEADPTRFDPQIGGSSFFDQALQDFVGNQIQSLFGKQLTDLIGVDEFKVFPTSTGIGAHLEHKLVENIDLIGDYENNIRGSSLSFSTGFPLPWRVFRNSDPFAMQGGYVLKSYDDPSEQDISDLQLKLVYRFFVP